jgi:hypothetical protein
LTLTIDLKKKNWTIDSGYGGNVTNEIRICCERHFILKTFQIRGTENEKNAMQG